MSTIAFGPTGPGKFVVPRFGSGCVCCGASALGRTQDYDPSTDRVRAQPVPMPVCFECRGHALQTPAAAITQTALLLAGACGVALGLYYRGQRPDDEFLLGVIAVSLALTLAAVAWMVTTVRRQRRERALAGHHPHLVLGVVGATVLTSTNEALIDELLGLNPDARRVPDRAGRGRIPAARVVRLDAGVAAGHDPALADAIVARMLAGKPADLEAVRGMAATPTLDHRQVEALLAEVERLLGRPDLIARYRQLRASPADAGPPPT